MTKQETQLKALVALCGNPGNAAFLLGLSRKTICDFLHKRRKISAIGALLAERSEYLFYFFTKEDLRPDCTPETWIYYKKHAYYRKARDCQAQNEKSAICKLMPPATIVLNQCRSPRR